MGNDLKKILTTDGISISYQYNKVGRSCLVLLHGLGGNLTAWDEEVKLFNAAGLSTLAIDLRGHGMSDRPAEIAKYSVERFTTDIHEVLEDEKIKNFSLVGHCFGGMIAMYYMYLFPEDVKSLILINSSYKPMKGGRLARMIAKNFSSLISKVAIQKHFKSYLDFKKYIGTYDLDPRRLAGDIAHTSPKSYINSVNQFIDYNATNILPEIKVPTLVLHGSKDVLFSVDVAKRMSDSIPNSQLVYLEKANHISVINNSKEVGEAIIKFCESM